MRRITDDRAILVDDDTVEISAIELQISEIAPYLGARKKIVITADILHFDMKLVAPEAEVVILAREINARNSGLIDVSGKDGRDAPQTKKPKPGLGNTAEDQRPHGADGGDGTSAGSIKILARNLNGDLHLKATGGEGGLAQPGGDGADGKPGTPGRVIRKYTDDGSAGGDGGDAGRPGRAGTPGKSADGGMVIVNILHGSESVSTSVSGGKEVPAATHGVSGRAGPEGHGTNRVQCELQYTSGGGINLN